jgi:hypothetical protein
MTHIHIIHIGSPHKNLQPLRLFPRRPPFFERWRRNEALARWRPYTPRSRAASPNHREREGSATVSEASGYQAQGPEEVRTKARRRRQATRRRRRATSCPAAEAELYPDTTSCSRRQAALEPQRMATRRRRR